VKQLAQFLKLLADEARIQMLWLLLNHRELCVCDLTAALGVTQSKASRHLATLRHAGLVTDRKEAAWSYYSLCPTGNEVEQALLDALRAKLADHPGAVRVLQNLHDWMQRKERDATRVPGGACCPLKKLSSGRRPRAAFRKGPTGNDSVAAGGAIAGHEPRVGRDSRRSSMAASPFGSSSPWRSGSASAARSRGSSRSSTSSASARRALPSPSGSCQ